MGIGWILISFGLVTGVLYFLARQGGGEGIPVLPQMAMATVGALVVGGVLFAAGYLLSRVGRGANQPAPTDRSIA